MHDRNATLTRRYHAEKGLSESSSRTFPGRTLKTPSPPPSHSKRNQSGAAAAAPVNHDAIPDSRRADTFFTCHPCRHFIQVHEPQLGQRPDSSEDVRALER